MSDELKALNRRFNEEVINEQNLGTIDELVAEDIVDHIPLPGQGPGRGGIAQALGLFYGAFPDLRIEVVEELAEGDVVAQVVRLTGTHRGEFMGMPATGKVISVLGSDFIRVRGGRMVEHWGFIDQGALMQQLGMGPGGPAGG
jgi:steroid delta-isomerase-like uncharacterized protein